MCDIELIIFHEFDAKFLNDRYWSYTFWAKLKKWSKVVIKQFRIAVLGSLPHITWKLMSFFPSRMINVAVHVLLEPSMHAMQHCVCLDYVWRGVQIIMQNHVFKKFSEYTPVGSPGSVVETAFLD